jgi:tetratricopeptide (TPR) repeat protein
MELATNMDAQDELDGHLIDAINRMNSETFKTLTTKLLRVMGLDIISSEFADDRGDFEARVGEIINDAAYPAYLIRIERKKEMTTPQELQDFYSARKSKDMGTIFISTADFTDDAIRYAEEFEIDIVDDNRFAALLRKFDLLPDVMIYRDKDIMKREKGRFLPSVDELENILEQGDRAYTRGHFHEALRYFSRATELKPNYDAAWFMKGIILNNIDRYEEALESFLQVIEINSENEEAWYNMGLSLYALGRYDEEIECYNRAILLKKDFLNAWNNKGTTLLQLERIEEAIDCFDEVLKYDPKFEKAMNNKGIALKKQKKGEEALNYFSKAIKINPTFLEAWLNKGIVHLDAKQYKEAYHCFEAVLRMDKGNVQAMYSKARTLEGIGQYSLAIEIYDNIITRDPKFRAAKRRLKKAEKNREVKGDSPLDRDFFKIDAEKVGEYLAAVQERQQERILVEKKTLSTEYPEVKEAVQVPSPEPQLPTKTAAPPPKAISHDEMRKLLDMKKELEKKAKEMTMMETQLREKYEAVKKEGEGIKTFKSNLTKTREDIEKEKMKVRKIAKGLEEKAHFIAQAEEKIKEANEQIKKDWAAIEKEKELLESKAEDITKGKDEFQKERDSLKEKLTESELKEKNILEAEKAFSSEKEALDKEKRILESERMRAVKEKEDLETMETSIKIKEEEMKKQHDEMQKKIDDISSKEKELEDMAVELKSAQDELELKSKILNDKEKSMREDAKIQTEEKAEEEDMERIEEFIKDLEEPEEEEELPPSPEISEETKDKVEGELPMAPKPIPDEAKPRHIVSVEEWTEEDFPYEESGLIKEISASYGLEHFDKAQEFIDNALQGGHESKLLWILKGDIMCGKKDYEGALKCYTSALKYDQNDQITLVNLMSLSLKMGRYDEAYGWCEKVVALRPHDEVLALKKAELNIKFGQIGYSKELFCTA